MNPKKSNHPKQFEIVHTITDEWDPGPTYGIANYQGKPHIFAWRGDCYFLQPVDDETLQLAREERAIWYRWRRAFDAGQTTKSEFPALPHERTRHEELAAILKPRLEIDRKKAFRVTGEFEGWSPPDPDYSHCRVCWTPYTRTA